MINVNIFGGVKVSHIIKNLEENVREEKEANFKLIFEGMSNEGLLSVLETAVNERFKHSGTDDTIYLLTKNLEIELIKEELLNRLEN